MTLSIYLNFDGNCREAFEFYHSAFGGEFMHISTFGEGPPDMGVPEEESERIMHVSLPIGDSVLMGSDTSPTFGPPYQAGNNFSVSCHPQTREETDRLFAAISAARHRYHGPRRHVLGLLLRRLRRQVRHPLAVQL